MKKVFIETTIPSFYFETRRTAFVKVWREITRRWWDEHRSRYEVVTSDYVLLEISRAPAAKSSQALSLLESVEVLGDTPRVHEIAAAYMRSKVMPAEAEGDALHLAFASLHACDYLLTWNCKHLANANKWSHIRQVNARLRLSTPEILTPDMILAENIR